MSYEEDMKQLIIILDQLITVLKADGELDWSNCLHKFRVDCEYVESDQEADYVRQGLITIYGGMGSFNDIGLEIDHTKFAKLKTLLFNTILKQKTKEHKDRNR